MESESETDAESTEPWEKCRSLEMNVAAREMLRLQVKPPAAASDLLFLLFLQCVWSAQAKLCHVWPRRNREPQHRGLGRRTWLMENLR